jgi:predicted metal-dependent TIM-barrel fold hydrolase
VPDLVLEMRRRGHKESLIKKVVYDNPRDFFSQSKNFNLENPAER